MQFHEYVTLRNLWSQGGGIDRRLEAKAKSLSSEEFRRQILDTFPKEVLGSKQDKQEWLENQLRQARCEQRWVELDRLFYNVWPVTVSLAKSVSLNLPFSAVTFPFEFLVLRFAVGQEPHSVACVMMRWEKTRRLFTLDCHRKNKLDGEAIKLENHYEPEDRVEDFLTEVLRSGMKYKFCEHMDNPQFSSAPEFAETSSLMIRLSVFISLLAKGDDLITPVVLSKDQGKYDATDDPNAKQWLETRAIKRMGRGFNVCKRLEIERSKSVHWRNPHLALFWTGAGRTQPMIKLRSGAVIERVSMAEVPTGYLGPERPDEDYPEDVVTIYFIEAIGQDRIKIGKTRDPKNRLRQLQTGSASKLQLLGVIVDKANRESELHALFAEDRIQGEWFRDTASLRSYIRDFAKPYEAND